jgi:YggT family protein
MTLSFLVASLAQIMIIAIIIRALLSWFPIGRTLAPVSIALNQVTDPILRPIQERLRPVAGFDFSPLVAILLISVAESVLLTLLAGH